jgi:hypothetical protein
LVAQHFEQGCTLVGDRHRVPVHMKLDAGHRCEATRRRGAIRER